MLVVMQAHATGESVRGVCDKIESLGYRAHAIPGAERTAIGITGNKGEVEPGTLDEMRGVHEVVDFTKHNNELSSDTEHKYAFDSLARPARGFLLSQKTSDAAS